MRLFHLSPLSPLQLERHSRGHARDLPPRPRSKNKDDSNDNIDWHRVGWDNDGMNTEFDRGLDRMPTPKRSPIERASIEGIGDLRRNNQLSREGQKGIGKRVSRRAKKLK